MGFKHRTPTFYETESERIKERMVRLEPGTEEYKKAMDDLVALRKFTGDEKEMKQFLDKPGRASLIGKAIGFLGIGGLILGMTKFEKIDGGLLTGTNAETEKGLLKAAFKLLG